ncbi:hypothetical protein MJO28_013572 [Puccinia striiformis f. sp. tritici]|uniref:quinol--cytochrome-c reductase n=3 Tax=Puccinia striiformis TaxID=27350 RepID=A0A2S4VY37_9BASI|nr:hypothetical protein MJO28_013572 [Puccinia striiformis f. sp. tritici]KAI7941326.1 hypothetical protein MJO29_013400 [Puccinia striiformis f. sp. tritici]POW14430.1 hypothetical protein PSTT_02977 [Puccinia striiformis]POW19411.1 hypothetical protein PSHT_04689 [Puccinia striiformis]
MDVTCSVLDVEDLPGSSTESPGKASQPEQAQSSSSQHTAGKPTSNHTPLLQLARDETEERRVEIEIGIEMAFPSNRFVFANLIKNSSSNNTRHQFTNNIKANLNRRTFNRSASTTTQTESILTSRTAAAVSSILAVGSITWYTQLYGVPFLSEAKAMTAAEHGLHPPSFAWPHKGPFETFDHAASVLRYPSVTTVPIALKADELFQLSTGFRFVYNLNFITNKKVFVVVIKSTAKSAPLVTLLTVSHGEICRNDIDINRKLAFPFSTGAPRLRSLTGMAGEIEYEDGPDDEGKKFMRPGKLSDYMPRPYPNDEAARSANAGALPPDLSLIVKARHGAADYIMALLTGYVDPPAGVEIREGLNYNPYFPGGAIGMARVLYDGIVDYPDGTPASTSQMAKDVVTFLNWAAEPELDQRKKMGFQTVIVLTTLTALSIWVKRLKWAGIKSRKIVYNPPPPSKH